MQPPTDQPPFIALRGITKAFPPVLANDHIDLDIHRARIHALLGENGAGKSTLMKVLFGFYRLDAGQVLLDGQPVRIDTPQDARRFGIGMVFQDLNLIPAFTVAENIALFLPELPAVLDARAIDKRIREVSERYGLQVNPQALVSHLSIGEQQKVEILKLLLSDARLLILDEPTRVLAPHELSSLYGILHRLRADGYAIIIITHKLKDVLACADQITVLRNGRVTGSISCDQASEDILVNMMFEKHLSALQPRSGKSVDGASSPVLELSGVHTRADGAAVSLAGIDLQIRLGEIVGVAGVSGNGQKELCDVVLGMETCTQGHKYLNGRDYTNCPVQDMRRAGVSFIPENPLAMASVPYMTVLENMALTDTQRYSRRGGFALDWASVGSDMRQSMQQLGFEVNLYSIPKALSGGNLQRMVIVREMTHAPRLIIASYLTRGLDVQSALAAQQALAQAAEAGAAVLLVSEDLEELFALSDRLVVLYGGRIVGQFRPAETDIYEIGHLMTGSKVEHGTQH